jgi:hypothetical protein
MSDARIRFWCLVLPTDGLQLGAEYLAAIDATRLGVRACPIGPAFLMAGLWPKFQNLFLGVFDVAKTYVNIVCAPPNLLMGTTLRAADVMPNRDEKSRLIQGPKLPLAEGTKIEPHEPIYKAQTALAGLYTVGVPNVAITMARPKPPDEHEIAALLKYDAVLAPSDKDADDLGMLGVPAIYLPAEPDRLRAFLSLLLP